jgi:hypothetical protein
LESSRGGIWKHLGRPPCKGRNRIPLSQEAPYHVNSRPHQRLYQISRRHPVPRASWHAKNDRRYAQINLSFLRSLGQNYEIFQQTMGDETWRTLRQSWSIGREQGTAKYSRT